MKYNLKKVGIFDQKIIEVAIFSTQNFLKPIKPIMALKIDP